MGCVGWQFKGSRKASSFVGREESRSSNAVSGSLYDKRILTTRWASVARSISSKVLHCHSALGRSPHIRKGIDYFCKKSGKVRVYRFLFHL